MTDSSTMTSTAPLGGERVRTGIEGLDHILGGGLPEDRLYLVEGMPGAGKTTLALQFLLEGARKGERGMYVTLSETTHELKISAASHGWSLDGFSIVELVPDDELTAEHEQTFLHPAEFELGETTKRVIELFERERPSRLVFDSLSELRLLAHTALKYRRQVLALKHFFTKQGCTVLLLDDKTAEPRDQQLHSIAHGVIALDKSSSHYGAQRRSVEIVKMRGVVFHGGHHDYNIETGGLVVFPRLAVSDHRDHLDARLVPTGMPELDMMLGGGLVAGTSTLIMGPAGTGKTTTTTRCLLSVLERGDPASVFMFDESLATFFTRSVNLGMDLRSYLKSGQLKVRQIDPAELSPGEFVHFVRRSVETDGAKMIMIDSLNGYIHAMPNEEFLLLQMHELLTYLAAKEVMTLLILGQHGLVGDVRSNIDLSYLSDTVLLMRFFETSGTVRRAMSVVKTRTSRHEATIREFSLSQNGITIGSALKDFDGILSGVPVYRGEAAALMGAGRRQPQSASDDE